MQLRALALLGNAYQHTDEPDRADEIYKKAFELIRRSQSILQSDAANVLFRFSYVLCARHRYQPAANVAGQSIGTYREAPKDVRCRYLGEALAARGYAHHRNGQLASAMRDWGEAVASMNVRKTPRIFYTAVHNLMLGMSQSVIPSRDLSAVEKWVTQASRSFSRQLLSLPKLKVRWIQGTIQTRFGSTRRGEATYRKVIDGFLKLGETVDAALVSVTLGKQLCREGRLEELQMLAIEINETCERLCRHEPVQGAILIWKETVVARAVSPEVFATTWNVLESASFERATGLTADVSALPPRIPLQAHICGSNEKHIA